MRVVHHPQNRGLGGGFVTGAQAARGEWLILIPADLALDLEHHPGKAKLNDDFDIVIVAMIRYK